MLHFFNHSTLLLKHGKADSVAVKGQNTAVKLYTLTDGVAEINTDDFAVGEYAVQFFKGDQVVEQTVLVCKQNLKFAPVNFDPRSPARIILDAINAVLAGRATQLQQQVRVGDKFIRYLSYDQLIKWREFYAVEVRKEEGKAGSIRFEKYTYRGI